jgi:hypothetical protein
LSEAASIIQFDNVTDFVQQTGATLHTLPSNIVQAGFFSTGNGLTFSDGPSACGLYTHAANFNVKFPYENLGLCGVENYNVAIAGTGSYAFGLSIFQPNTATANECNDSCTHGQFSVTLLLGATQVDSQIIDPTDETNLFFGFWLDNKFDTVLIRDLSNDIDNEFFANFYTGANPASATAVPEPSCIALVGTAGAGLLAMLRRRKGWCG